MKYIASILFLIVFIAVISYVVNSRIANKKISALTTTTASYNFDRYKKIMETRTLWYLDPELKPKLDEYFKQPEDGKSQEFIKEKRAFIQVVGDMLAEGKIKLGSTGTNFDKGREKLSTIVIHHTDTSPEADYNYIQGIHLFTLYYPEYSNPESDLYAKPIYSGHFDESGKQVFFAYHYLVKPDGTFKNALRDNYIGWHARSANPYSISISFIGQYDSSRPTEQALKTAKKIIATYPTLNVVGHREVVHETTCPGEEFLGNKGWENELF